MLISGEYNIILRWNIFGLEKRHFSNTSEQKSIYKAETSAVNTLWTVDSATRVTCVEGIRSCILLHVQPSRLHFPEYDPECANYKMDYLLKLKPYIIQIEICVVKIISVFQNSHTKCLELSLVDPALHYVQSYHILMIYLRVFLFIFLTTWLKLNEPGYADLCTRDGQYLPARLSFQTIQLRSKVPHEIPRTKYIEYNDQWSVQQKGVMSSNSFFGKIAYFDQLVW